MEIWIREQDPLPIYEQIVREIKKAILQEEMKAGDMLPSIRSLAKNLEISVITTKRAYEELEKEGIIYSVAGKGFYVKEANQNQLKEEALRTMEAKLQEVISQARELDVSLEELEEMVRMLYEGGKSL